MQRVLLFFANANFTPKKSKLMLPLLLLFFANMVNAQTSGIFESYAILSLNGGANAYYDMQASTGNPDFQGANLGSFALATNTLVVKGGQNKTFKNGGCDITGSNIYYRVFRTGNIPGSFTTINEPFLANLGGGDQSWESTAGAANLITGLVPGNYTLEVYSDATYASCGSGTHFSSNGGANYKATFDVTPDPLNPITVTATGGTTFANYANMASAITAINAGTHTGTIVCYAPGGYTETAPVGGYAITATGTLGNTITFTRLSGGANPAFTANAALVAGALNDAIFKIIGGDFITIEGYQMLENAANVTTAAATNNMTEFGVALFYASATDGCQNITIRNNIIDLNRTYQNTFGIYANSTHTASVVTVSATATGATGGNNNLTITGNGITDVNNGIVIVGPTADADQNTNLTIGGSLINQNTITNFGTTGTFSSYANVSGTVNGILVRNAKGFTISFNAITSSTGAAGVTAGTLNGIQVPTSSVVPTGTFTNTINSNTISLQSANLTGAITGISIPSGSASATSTMNIDSNNFASFAYNAAASGAVTFITDTAAHQFTTINSNTFTNISLNTSGSVTFISQSFTAPSNGTKAVNSNSIVTGFVKTIAGGSVIFITDNGSTVSGAISNCQNNNFSNVTLTGATGITGINYTDGGTAPTRTVSGNVLNNWTTGASAINAMNFTYWNGVSSLSSNTITNITGQSSVTGITIGSTVSTATSITLASNIINNLSSTGAGGAVNGILCSNTSTLININDNLINTLSSTGASVVTGVSITGATTTNVFKNKIYDLAGSSASSTVNGIAVSSGTTVTVHNNLVGDLRTPNANAANPLVGINITGGSTSNIYYNTVYLNGTSVGALFGSSAISASTTPTVTLRNNIFVNTSTPVGATGFTAAYRRSSTTLTSYGSTSNNNLFFAGTPGVNNLIFFDGTNSDQTITAFKSRVATRDALSVTENMVSKFLSTAGANANFLHIDPTIATQAESGGAAIAGITIDYDGATRNATTPDIGADEFTGITADFTAPVITYTNLSNTSAITNRAFGSITITDFTGVNTTAGTKPRLYYKKATDTNDLSGWKFVEANGTTSPFDFTIDYSLLTAGSVTAGDNIQYFVVAQDTAPTPNVGINSGTFSAAPATVALGATQFPITGTINSYNIVGTISGTKTVCPSGCDYTTLTVAGGAFAAINGSEVNGNLTLEIAGDLTAETGAIALNEFATPFTVTIKPTGVARAISGTSATALIVLFGADNVTIDGSLGSVANTICPLSTASRDLTITNSNTSTSSAVVGIQNSGTNASSNNTIKNCNIVGNSNVTTLVGLANASSAAGPGNNNNAFVNNNISKVQIGISSAGGAIATKNSGTIINQNIINGTVVSGNNVRIAGISASFENNITISGNNIANVAGSNGDGFGIACGSTLISTTGFTGSEVINATITNNIIDNIRAASTFSVSGIYVVTSTNTGTNLIANNSIANTSINGTSGDFGSGIFVGGGAVTTNVYHNTVFMSGTSTGGSQPNFALAIGGSNPIVNIRNNMFLNSAANGSATTLGIGSYAIGYNYSTFTNLTVNNNNYFTSGAIAKFAKTGSLVTASGTDVANLAALQTATGQDAASVSVSPVFASATDLRPLNDSANLALYNSGANLSATVSNDIDCASRPTNPSLGFKEFTVTLCTVAVGGTATPVNGNICGASGSTIVNASGFSGGINTTYQWQSSVDLAFTTPVAIGSPTASYAALNTGTITTTTYYRLEVICTAGPSTSYSSVATVMVNSIPVVTITPGSTTTFCAGGTVNLVASGATTYAWSPATGLDFTNVASVNANPSVTTTYSVIGTSNGCPSVAATITVVVNPIPTGVTATAMPTVLCEGDALNLTSSFNAASLGSGMSAYVPTRATGTGFTSIFPATTITSWRNSTPGNVSGGMSDDNLSNAQPIGFSFNYNGNSYSNFLVSTNGFITFNTATAATGTASTPYGFTNSWTGSPDGLVLAPNWDDLQTAGNIGSIADLNASINYTTTGSAGNRVLTVEWKNMQDFTTTSTASYNMQVKLYESDGRIEYVYGTMTQSAASVSYSLGLSAATVSATPTAAQLLCQTTVNSGSFGFTNQNSLTPVPATNTTISFVPSAPVYSWSGPNGFSSNVANPTISSATAAASGVYNLVISNSATGCPSAQASTASVTVNGSSVAGSVSSDQTICTGSQPSDITLTGSTGAIQWQSATTNVPASFANIPGQTSATLTGASIGNLTATRYFRAIVTSGACASATSAVVTVNANPAIWTGSQWLNGITPDASTAVIFEGNYASVSDITACSLIVRNNAVVVVNSNHDFNITGNVDVQTGSLTFANNANLLQDPAATVNGNTGNVVVTRNASMRRQDYVYWSSPVANQNLLAFSPLTLTNRFYQINEVTNSFVPVNPATNSFVAPNGYAIRAPNTFPPNGDLAAFAGQFTGVANNGDYSVAITNSGAGKGYNLVGNPYPSPIDADLFLAENPGTLYFWTHFSQAATSGNNYATYNGVGAAAAAGGETPNGFIQTGQGFLLNTAANGTADFNNGMRVGNNQGQFYRTANVERHRIWMNLSSDATPLLNQALIGYMTGATQDVDQSLDGPLNYSGSSISSVINDGNYVIQGRSLPFADTDEVPMNFKAETDGSYTLAIDHVDGLFAEGQDIFLRDNLTGIVHNIKESAYTFASVAGTFANRFVVVYQSSPLGIETPGLDANSVIVFKKETSLHINSGAATMATVRIFDIRGRMIFEQDGINASTMVVNNLRAEQQVLIVQITSDDNKTVSKKVVY